MDIGSLVLGISIVIATVTGPVIAVYITRRADDDRRVRERRLDIFRSLMATRRAQLAPEKVRALNLVEIDFYGLAPIIEAHRQVMMHINSSQPAPAGWLEHHQKLLTKLLSEMARVLGYELQQLDVLEGGYYPQGFVDLEQQTLRRVLVEVFSGNRPLTISPAAPTPPAPFPPPPAPAALTGGKK